MFHCKGPLSKQEKLPEDWEIQLIRNLKDIIDIWTAMLKEEGEDIFWMTANGKGKKE